VNLAGYRLKTATLGLRTTAAGKQLKRFSPCSLSMQKCLLFVLPVGRDNDDLIHERQYHARDWLESMHFYLFYLNISSKVL